MDKPLKIRDLDPVTALENLKMSVMEHSLPATMDKPLRTRELDPVAVKQPKRTDLDPCPILSFTKALQPTRLNNGRGEERMKKKEKHTGYARKHHAVTLLSQERQNVRNTWKRIDNVEVRIERRKEQQANAIKVDVTSLLWLLVKDVKNASMLLGLIVKQESSSGYD
ncbi:hypothetical protein FVER14953_12007 [Fusarium verticillioides]|nr:hypothetical protein FVER14953_12007 [Fusarium verticillioides]